MRNRLIALRTACGSSGASARFAASSSSCKRGVGLLLRLSAKEVDGGERGERLAQLACLLRRFERGIRRRACRSPGESRRAAPHSRHCDRTVRRTLRLQVRRRASSGCCLRPPARRLRLLRASRGSRRAPAADRRRHARPRRPPRAAPAMRACARSHFRSASDSTSNSHCIGVDVITY